jgi:tetratricopeptide (TPR) repeat protein
MPSHKVIGITLIGLGIGVPVIFIFLWIYNILSYESIIGIISFGTLGIIGVIVKFLPPTKRVSQTKEEQLVRSRNHDKAIEYYTKRIRKRKKNTRLLGNLSSLYIIKEDYEQAIEICRQLLEQKPNHNKALYNLAKAYYHMKMYDNAIETLMTLLNNLSSDFFFKDYELWNELAEIYLQKGDLNKALEWNNKSLELRPRFSKALELQDKIQSKINEQVRLKF